MKVKLFEQFNMDVNRSDIGVNILEVLSQIQIYHWQTDKYGLHKTFDDFSGKFKDNGDRLLEVIQGKYGRILLDNKTSLKIENISDLSPEKYIDEKIKIFNNYRKEYNKDEEISAILDEINAEFEQLKYLMTFE